MGKRIKVVLGDTVFSSLSATTKKFSEMLSTYAIGDTVSKEDGALLAELIKRHPESGVKIGVGVAHFEVIDGGFDTQCFAVRRKDGSFEDFSFHTCVSEGRY